MNLEHFIDRLTKNRAVFKGLAKDLQVEQARWKPSSDKWSILEVVNHLYDEEREDFRQRLQLLFRDPSQPWPPIDPPNWVVQRAYNERDPNTSLNNFLEERDKSLAWLKQLSEPNWQSYKDRPDGTLSAGDLMASWVAHDFLHIRQIARLHWQYVSAVAEPYQTQYAGPWKAS